MHELVKIKSAELFPFIDELLQKDEKVWITVTGNSMYPLLREGIDSVELSKATFETVKKNDIILIKRKNGGYVLHRLLRKEKDCFYMIGDAQQWVEGPLYPEQLKAFVTSIKTRKHTIKCDNMLYKLCVKIWMLLIPFRYKIIKVIGKLGRLLKRCSLHN